MIHITNVRHAWPNPPGFMLDRPHGHRDYTFLHFITSVEFRLDGTVTTIPEHSCIIYRPGTPQYFSCPQGMLHDWFHFSSVSQDLFDWLDLPTDVLLFPKQWEFISDLTIEIENEFMAKKELSAHMIDAKATELFVRLSRTLKMQQTEVVNQATHAEFRKLRSKIIHSLSYNWTVAEMANELHLSKSRFSHLYRSLYGTSPIDDLIRARIDSAKSALKYTNYTIYEIAESLGYLNTTHFCRQFRQLVGVSPFQYRKSNL